MLFPHLLSSLENVAELQVNKNGKGRKMTIESESDGPGVIEVRLTKIKLTFCRGMKKLGLWEM